MSRTTLTAQTTLTAALRRTFLVATKSRNLRIWPKFVAGASLTGGFLYFTNDTFHDVARHTVLTAERVSVVTWSTLKCFKIYKNVLGRDYLDEKTRKQALSEAHLKAAKFTLKALETNGGIYIKLGQHVSALTYILPPEWTETMIPLQDKCPQSSKEDIENMFRKDLGIDIDDYFSEFHWNPVGVASLAQVHVATVRDSGQKVAVKMQHPLLAEFVPLDVYLTQAVFELISKVFPEYPMTWLSDELRNSIYVELDFAKEAVNAENTIAQFDNLLEKTALRVPRVIRAEKRILIMEYVAGKRLDDLQYLKDNSISTAEVSSCLSHIFNNMIFTPNFGLHCDPHLGNLAIRPVNPVRESGGHNFEIILYDHGLYRYIPLQMKRDYSHFWLAVLDNDVEDMKKYAEKFAGIRSDRKFKVFISAITGRDLTTAVNYDISQVRTESELYAMQQQLYGQDGILESLMDILSNMPRIVLLILKTNDLTRNLDEVLGNSLGPKRTFLIMANYCAKVVYDEAVEQNNRMYSRCSWSWISSNLSCWCAYQRRKSLLFIYDVAAFFRDLQRSFL